MLNCTQDGVGGLLPLHDLSFSIYISSTEYIFLLEMKQGQCICQLSWSVHCNFTCDGKCNERGWACTPHPHQPGLILPSWWNVRQKAAVTTLCTLWFHPWLEPQVQRLQNVEFNLLILVSWSYPPVRLVGFNWWAGREVLLTLSLLQCHPFHHSTSVKTPPDLSLWSAWIPAYSD
jgi:hypothetical protein